MRDPQSSVLMTEFPLASAGLSKLRIPIVNRIAVS